MSQPQTVLAHLLEGRDELVREVQRLTTAIAELDAVIERVGGAASSDDRHPSASAPSAGRPRGRGQAATSRGPARRGRAAGASRRRATASADRSADRPGGASGAAAGGPGTKSIRIHVLEMLAAEPRDFALAEIIERIHAAGIAAHDDAVRSITIKLMKDGQVERVGRGQYRLAAGAHPGAGAEADPVDGAEPAGPASLPASPPGIAPALNLGEHWRPPAQ